MLILRITLVDPVAVAFMGDPWCSSNPGADASTLQSFSV